MKKIRYSILVLLSIGCLTACGVTVEKAPETDNSSPSVRVVDGDQPHSNYDVVKKEVEPGKFVTCVSDREYKQGGLSCDWVGYHAEYDDNPES